MYVPYWNSLIMSGQCGPIDPKYSDMVKMRVECQANDSIKFRYFNQFGDDQVCGKDAESDALSTGLSSIVA